jgi:DNA-binding MarR family transcriptional regulator
MIDIITRVLQSNPITEDITIRQLRMLVLANDANPGVTIRNAAILMRCQPPACSRATDRLVHYGLVERKIDRADRRSLFVCATHAGRQLLKTLNAAITRGQKDAPHGEGRIKHHRYKAVEKPEIVDTFVDTTAVVTN